MAETTDTKTFTGSKKAIGYVLAVGSLIGAYYAGMLIGLSEAVMKDLTTKLTALGVVYIGGQSAVDSLSKIVTALMQLKGLLIPGGAAASAPAEPPVLPPA